MADDGSAILTVVGEIDLATAPGFRRALGEAASTHPAIAVIKVSGLSQVLTLHPAP